MQARIPMATEKVIQLEEQSDEQKDSKTDIKYRQIVALKSQNLDQMKVYSTNSHESFEEQKAKEQNGMLEMMQPAEFYEPSLIQKNAPIMNSIPHSTKKYDTKTTSEDQGWES